jgi:hypothetical protein
MSTGTATAAPPVSSQPTSSKPAGPSLKKQWDLTDPPPLDSGTNEKAKTFVNDFKAAMEPVKQCLLYTKVNAEKPKHDAMINKRDPLYAEFPSKLAEVNKDESKADAISKPFLDRARALSGEANKLKQDTEKSLKAWQAKEPAYTKSEQEIEELEKWKGDDEGYKNLRKAADEVRSAINENKYDEAVKRLTQLETNLKPIFEAYQKQKAAKETYDANWKSIQSKAEGALAAEAPVEKLKVAQEKVKKTKQEMDKAAEQKDYVTANTSLDKLPAVVDEFEKADQEYKEAKKSYETAWNAIKSDVEKAIGETVKAEKSKQAQQLLNKTKGEMEQAAKKNDFPAARKLLDKVMPQVAAFQKVKKEEEPNSSKDSPDFKQGHKDGLSGGESRAIPRAGTALEEYNQGYAKGRAEAVDKQHKQQGEPPRLEDTAQAHQEGYDDGRKGRIGVCHVNATPAYEAAYQNGYTAGKAEAEKVAPGQAVRPSRPGEEIEGRIITCLHPTGEGTMQKYYRGTKDELDRIEAEEFEKIRQKTLSGFSKAGKGITNPTAPMPGPESR